MNKRRIIISRAVKDLSVFAVIALSLLSCIEGDLYELYDEDECVVDCQISRRKRKQFDGGLNTSIGGQSESVLIGPVLYALRLITKMIKRDMAII